MRSCSVPLAVVVALWSAPAFAAAVQVYWASDPVGPGAAVMVIGDALGEQATVEIVRLADTAAGSPASVRARLARRRREGRSLAGDGEFAEVRRAGDASTGRFRLSHHDGKRRRNGAAQPPGHLVDPRQSRHIDQPRRVIALVRQESRRQRRGRGGGDGLSQGTAGVGRRQRRDAAVAPSDRGADGPRRRL